MTQIEKIYLLDRLHGLIRRKGTGSPKALASRLEVSERTVYNLIDILRGLGIEICYCKDRESYYYVEEVVLNFLPVFDQKAVKGGVRISRKKQASIVDRNTINYLISERL